MSASQLPLPSIPQIYWQDLNMGFFCHFGMNTFCDQEWGDGTDSPEKFNPTELDAHKWVKLAKDAGFKYFILTAKHYDGFCLWPTKTTDYSVKSSPWKDGKGDVVKECAEACKKEGIHFGVYLSPWDRNAACYEDKEAYDNFYCEQLTELLTQYGPMIEIWFDGAGSEGKVYDWEREYLQMNLDLVDGLLFSSINITHQGKTVVIPHVVIDKGAAESVISIDAVQDLFDAYEPEDQIRFMTGIGGKEAAIRRKVDGVEVWFISRK